MLENALFLLRLMQSRRFDLPPNLDRFKDTMVLHATRVLISKKGCEGELQVGLAGMMSFVGFDILPAECQKYFVRKSWFDVKLGQLPPPVRMDMPSNIVIGLNPPFGVRNAMAIKFIKHGLQFRPRLIVLIVPQVCYFAPL